MVNELINDMTVRLKFSEPTKAKHIQDAFHVSLLKPCFPDDFKRYERPLPPIKLDDGTEEYEVEAKLVTKTIRGKQHFLVKWKGYINHENTWQTRNDLENCPDLLKEFEALRQRLS